MQNNDILDILIKNNINGFKYPGGTDKASCHTYDELYCELFSKYRDKAGSILEIGIQYGGSALLWHEYLPLFHLTLIDTVNQIHTSILDKLSTERYEYIEIDAFKQESIDLLKQKYPEGFDIIVDDGPHYIETQTFTLQEYSKLLKKGGTLVIEDIQKFENIEPIMSSFNPDEFSSLKYYDFREIKGRGDDLLIILTK